MSGIERSNFDLRDTWHLAVMVMKRTVSISEIS